MPAPLRTWCTVSFSALRANLRTLRSAAPRGTRILAVVKDNAYGHGLVPVARALSRAGCEEFGVAFASEGPISAKQASGNQFFFLARPCLRNFPWPWLTG